MLGPFRRSVFEITEEEPLGPELLAQPSRDEPASPCVAPDEPVLPEDSPAESERADRGRLRFAVLGSSWPVALAGVVSMALLVGVGLDLLGGSDSRPATRVDRSPTPSVSDGARNGVRSSPRPRPERARPPRRPPRRHPRLAKGWQSVMPEPPQPTVADVVATRSVSPPVDPRPPAVASAPLSGVEPVADGVGEEFEIER